MVRHDLVCPVCNFVEPDVNLTPQACMIHAPCGVRMEILWTRSPTPRIGIHPRDRAVVWFNPRTGKHATPGRNDVPLPERYRRAGYERRDFPTLHALDTFCKQNKLVNEQAHYDKSGRAYDDE